MNASQKYILKIKIASYLKIFGHKIHVAHREMTPNL